MAKPEATFVRYINHRIDLGVYTQSMYTPFSNGTPDCYYESEHHALWIEYKYEKQIPKIYRLPDKLSALQTMWLNRCHGNGHDCAVVTGFGKNKVVVFVNGMWRHEHKREDLEPHIITRAAFIKRLDDTMLNKGTQLPGIST